MHWNTALHSVSYAGLWGQTTLALDPFLHKAQSLGFRSVMLMAKRPHLSPLDFAEAEVGALRERLQQLGLKVCCLAGYNDFGRQGDPVGTPFGEMQLLYIRELSRLARELDCELVRLFTGFAPVETSPEEAWRMCVRGLRESAQIAAEFGVTIGVQNHHDVAGHYLSLLDLVEEVGEFNCGIMFDAWAAALQGDDILAAAKTMAPRMVHTTVADYVRRPRFRYDAGLVNYAEETAAVRAVPMGSGFIDYAGFFGALREAGYAGSVAYEMCSPLQGGGSEANLDRYARRFQEYMHEC